MQTTDEALRAMAQWYREANGLDADAPLSVVTRRYPHPGISDQDALAELDAGRSITGRRASGEDT